MPDEGLGPSYFFSIGFHSGFGFGRGLRGFGGFGFGFPIFGLTNNVITRIDYDTFTGSVEPWLAISASGKPLSVSYGQYINADGFTSVIGSIQQIPEPSTMLLVAAAVVAGVSASRRRSA